MRTMVRSISSQSVWPRGAWVAPATQRTQIHYHMAFVSQYGTCLHCTCVCHGRTASEAVGCTLHTGELEGWSGTPAPGLHGETASPLGANMSRADLWTTLTSLHFCLSPISGSFSPPVELYDMESEGRRQILALPLIRWATLHEFLNLSELWFPVCKATSQRC